jgi:LuxR family maltose regulon positive regulatory protein
MPSELNRQLIIRTKLQRPRLPEDLIPRPRLLARLQRGLDRKLTLISAQAGAGKSTLLAQWLADVESTRRSAWLSLDEHDNDLVLFVSYLCEAVRTVYADACDRTLDLLKAPQTPPVRVLLASIVNELDSLSGDGGRSTNEGRSAKGLILALDDYHTITEPAIHEMMSSLVAYLPRGVHLALASRSDPPLPLVRLRAHGEMIDLRSADLRFTGAEAHALLAATVGRELSSETESFLKAKTEGWVIGLRLAALSMRRLADEEDFLRRFREAGSASIAGYLTDEVLSRQSSTVQEFALRTSILDRFSAPLCEAVCRDSAPAVLTTGISARESREILEWITGANMFLVPLDQEGIWYRYHHLFRDLLRLRLEDRYSPEEIAALHVRASEWLEENGLIEEAIRHILSAGEAELAAHLVERHRHEAMNREQWQRLERWLHLLPRQLIEGRVELLLSEAWLFNSKFSLRNIPPLLERVEVMLDQSESALREEERDVLRGEICALRSTIDYWTGRSQLSLDNAQRAIEITPPEHKWVRGIALTRRPLAFQATGQLNKAYRAIQELLAEGGQQDGASILHAYMTLMMMELVAGNLQGAEQAATRVLALARERRLLESYAWALQILGGIHYYRNDLAEAQRRFSQVGEMRYQINARTLAGSLFGLSLTYQALGRPDEAMETGQAAIAWATETGSAELLLEAHSLNSRLELLQGRIPDTRPWATLLDGVAPMLLGLEVPHITLATVLVAQGTSDALKEAQELLARLRQSVEAIHSHWRLIEIMALQALLNDALGEVETTVALLGKAVEMAEPGDFIRLFIDLGPPMALLLDRVREEGVAPDYIARILAAFASETEDPSAGRATEASPSSSILRGAEGLVETLTPRELQVLALLGQHLSNKEIAQELVVSPETVKTHTLNIYRKLDVRGRGQAAARARELGILAPT